MLHNEKKKRRNMTGSVVGVGLTKSTCPPHGTVMRIRCCVSQGDTSWQCTLDTMTVCTLDTMTVCTLDTMTVWTLDTMTVWTLDTMTVWTLDTMTVFWHSPPFLTTASENSRPHHKGKTVKDWQRMPSPKKHWYKCPQAMDKKKIMWYISSWPQ